eukprot:scaffold70690_cov47-Phaeocystis_antarctica.AAC.1
MARKTTHERYLSRRRSSQSDELPTNGGLKRAPHQTASLTGGTIGVWRLECCLRHIGRWQAGRSVDGTTASSRGVPRSAYTLVPRALYRTAAALMASG